MEATVPLNYMNSEPQTPTMQMRNLGGRVGSYAISTVDFNSWMNEPVTQAPQKTRKPRGCKEMIHRIFADCAAIVPDPFWADKFTNASMGKFPHKFGFHDGILSYRKGAKCNTLEISNNPYEAAYACMDFFRSNGGIFSPLDQQNSMELQYARTHTGPTQQLTWGDANKKVQECMLSYYVMDMKVLMELTDSEVAQLRQTIRLGIGNKYFGKHNIRVENSRIHSIEGLLWNNENRTFYINPELKPTTTRTYTRKKDGPPAIDPNQKDTIPQFGVKWKKYVDGLDKKIIRNNRRQRRITINYPDGTNVYNQSHVRHLQLVTTTGTTPVTDTDTFTDEDTDDIVTTE